MNTEECAEECAAEVEKAQHAASWYWHGPA